MKFRNILLIVGLLGFALVIVLNLHQLRNFAHLLGTIRWYVVIAVVLAQTLSYYLNGLYYRSILRVFNHNDVSLSRLFQGAMAANFINYIVPSAGLAGAGFFSQVLSPEVPRGKGVLIQFMRYGLSALAVLVMMPIGIALILISRSGSLSVDRLAIGASLGILAVVLALLGIINQEAWARRAIKWLESKFKRLFSKIKEGRLDNFIDEFYLGFRTMSKQKKRMLTPFGWSVIYILDEMLTLYLAFLAFGKLVNPGVIIMAYLIANISSTLGGALFSFGVFELGMLGTLVALGEPFVLSLSVTLFYRVLNLIIGLPPGFIFYRKVLSKT